MEDFLGWFFLLGIFYVIFICTKNNPHIRCFLLIAFLLRALCVLVNQYDLFILPDSTLDSNYFELTAREFSNNNGLLIIFEFLENDSLLISRIISIFYTLIGESKMMAQTISVALGTISVYLVYYLCLIIWDQSSAKKAAWLTAIFPTLILYSSLTLRETYIVFFLLIGLIGIAKFIRDKTFFSFLQVIISFYILMLFHGAASIGFFVFLFYLILSKIKGEIIRLYNLKINLYSLPLIIVFSTPIFFLLIGNFNIPYLPNLFDLDFIVYKANFGIIDKAAYPLWLKINSENEIFIKIIFKVIYFLYSPFIWDIKTFNHLNGLLDGTLYLILTFYIIKNWHAVLVNPITSFFVLLFLSYAIIHGLGIGNFGTGIRHRSKFVVILIVLAAPKINKFIFSNKKK